MPTLAPYSQLPQTNEASTYGFILAPGGAGKINTPGVYSLSHSGFTFLNGTSMAAPHVTGVAALVLQANPALTASEVRNIILDNSDTIDGYRALNAEKAVRAALETKNRCGSVTSPVIAGQQGPSYNVQANQSFGVTTIATPKAGYPYSSYQWETSEGIGNFTTTTNPANSLVLRNAGGASVTARPVLADGTVCSGATSQITVQSPLPVARVINMTPIDAVVGETRSFSITGANLPTTSPLDVTFNGCANIVFTLGQTTNLHQFTCVPQSAGTITAVIRTLSGTTPLGTYSVSVTAASSGVASTITIPATSFVRGAGVALSANGYGTDTLMNAPPYGAADNAAEWDFLVPVAGQYQLHATYASGESRPVSIFVDGGLVFSNVLAANTGGFFPGNRQTLPQGLIQLSAGSHILRAAETGTNVFPHIKEFTLVPVN